MGGNKEVLMSEMDRRVFVVIGLLALCVGLLAFVQVHIGPGKSDANSIISPWNHAQAPPQSISRSSVKIETRQNVQLKKENYRTASAAATLR